MFESQQREEIEAMMKSNAEFRRLYQYHRELDSKVHDAEIGALPMDSLTLSGMKRKKFYAKERLQQLWDTRQHSMH